MYCCFVCSKNFISVDVLCVHLKHHHMLKNDGNFKCVVNNCPSTFSKMNSYKRHLKNSHNNFTSDIVAGHTLASPIIYYNKDKGNFNQTIGIPVSDKIVKLDDSLGAKQNLETARQLISAKALEFYCKQSGCTHLTNSAIESLIIDFTEIVLNTIIQEIKETVLPVVCSSHKESVDDFLNFCSDPFQKIKSEYMLFKTLTQDDMYSPPYKFIVNTKIKEAIKKGKAGFHTQLDVGVLMPMDFQIKKFFELPGMLKSTLEYSQQLMKCSGDNISNFVQGDLWKNKMLNFQNKLVVPYFLYYDDFETGDPLGSSAGNQSIAGFYYSFPTVPGNNSSLENIFVCMLLRSQVLKEYGNSKCLYALVEVIKKLETEGIKFVIDDEEFTIYFVLGLVVGDNLGLNSLLGYAKSFSHKFFCRLCKVNKDDLNQIHSEDQVILRNKFNYAEDLACDSYTETGIRENSILNNIPSFHVTENMCVDIMHDVFEGVITYGLLPALQNFIFTHGFFNITVLNSCIQYFNRGEHDNSNKIPVFKVEHLSKGKIKLTARQAVSLLNYITCCLGSLVPRDDKDWKYICVLHDMVELLLFHSFKITDLVNLKKIIALHNKLYIETFEENLKPKHHMLIHYPNIIKMAGPLRLFWCMRYEAKHREIKNYTNINFSRVNLPWSIAKKCNIKFVYLIIINKHIKSSFKIIKKQNDNNINELVKKNCNAEQYSKYQNMISVLHLEYKNTQFKVNNYFCCENDVKKKQLFKIINIFVENNDIIIAGQHINISKFDNHYKIYLVGKELLEFTFFDLSNTRLRLTTLRKTQLGKPYIKYPLL